jgi:hypothetical protein
MYSTCLHCLAALGRNDALASFPVGRRLAFDLARGRLWAVCARCGRWNLAPLEERWEAVEECERRYRAATQRYGTDNIGLTGLRDGTELVRIGPALRPEIAVWRYGARLLRRRGGRRDTLWRASSALLGAGARAARWLSAGARAVPPEEQVLRLTAGLSGPGQRGERVLAVVRRDGAATVAGESTRAHAGAHPGNDVPTAILRRRHLATALLVRPERGEPWQLEIAHELGPIRLSGAEGLRTAGKIFAAVNEHVGSAALIAAAVQKVDDALEPDGYFRRVLDSAWRWQWGRSAAGPHVGSAASGAAAGGPAMAAVAGPVTDAVGGTLVPAVAAPVREQAEELAVQLTGRSFWAQGGIGSAERIALLRMPAVDRLALEMVAHEAAERAALDVELAALTAAWRDAEEIAAIADAL